MHKKNLTINYIYNLFYQCLLMVVPLITTPYVSRILGPTNIGIYSYTESIVAYFVLFGSLGIQVYGQREIAYLQDSKQKRSKIFVEIMITRLITLSISLLLFFLIFARNGEYSVYYKILILEIIANIIDISWYFQGLEEFKGIVLKNTLVKIASVVCIFLFVKDENDLNNYFLIYTMSLLIGNASLWTYLPKYNEKIHFKELRIIRHIMPALFLLLLQIAMEINSVLDRTMLGIMVTDKAEVGYYEQAHKIVLLFQKIITSLGIIMVPRVANTYANGDIQKLKGYINKSFNFVILLVCPVILGIISVSSRFVPIFFGEGYNKVIVLMNVLSPVLLVAGICNVIGYQYLLPTKQQNKLTIAVTIGTIFNFVLNIIFINLWQSVGTAISTTISELIVAIIEIYLVRKEIDFINVIKISKNYIISSLIMFIICIGNENFISNSLIAVITSVFISIFIYFGILFIMKDYFLNERIQTIKNFILKRKIKV